MSDEPLFGDEPPIAFRTANQVRCECGMHLEIRHGYLATFYRHPKHPTCNDSEQVFEAPQVGLWHVKEPFRAERVWKEAK